VLYLDSSALVKLVLVERETAILRAWAEERPLASSVIAATEVLRAVRRTDPDLEPEARLVLTALVLLDLSVEILERAAAVPPTTLRTLDAVHIATALALGDELDAMVTYDARMADAARLAGLRVDAPA
jgi:uncharacterized protein